MNVTKFSLFLLFTIGSILPFKPSSPVQTQTANIVVQQSGKGSLKFLGRLTKGGGKIVATACTAAFLIAYYNAKNKANTLPANEKHTIFNEQFADDWYEIVKTMGKGLHAVGSDVLDHLEDKVSDALVKEYREDANGEITLIHRYPELPLPTFAAKLIAERIKEQERKEKESLQKQEDPKESALSEEEQSPLKLKP